MFDPCPLISAKHGAKPIKLSRFINSKTRKQHTEPHDDHTCVSNALGCIVFFLWRQSFADVQIMQNNKP